MKDTRIYCQLVVHPDCQKDDEGMISASIKLASICSCKIQIVMFERLQQPLANTTHFI